MVLEEGYNGCSGGKGRREGMESWYRVGGEGDYDGGGLESGGHGGKRLMSR